MTLRIIAGLYKGRLLKTPKSSSTRPTQGMLREAVFNICQHQIEGTNVLDLYAGSGAVGLEALSRGARRATFIENNRQAAACIKENIAMLGVEEQTSLLSLDAHRAILQLSSPFDFIYIDPPYDIATAPLIAAILSRNLLAPHGLLFLEERYDPKKQNVPFQPPGLILKDSRRFGTALLHQYSVL